MARVESLKRKMTRLIIAIIVVSVGLVFLLQILLNVLEFSNFGKSLYTNFWKQPHYIYWRMYQYYDSFVNHLRVHTVFL